MVSRSGIVTAFPSPGVAIAHSDDLARQLRAERHEMDPRLTMSAIEELARKCTANRFTPAGCHGSSIQGYFRSGEPCFEIGRQSRCDTATQTTGAMAD
jgi:hypothetical protein